MRRKSIKFSLLLSRTQLILLVCSSASIVAGALCFETDALTLTASLVGAASLIFAAAGNILGPLLMILFSVLYGIISYDMRYYGEMITYLCMTAPVSAAAVVTWARNPAAHDSAQVSIAHLRRKDVLILILITCGVTGIFYYILDALGTASLAVSTVSVATSFAAAYLTAMRSPAYALLYAANDVVLIVLWIQATMQNTAYLSVVVCFAVFLINDMYGFVNWRKMQRAQSSQ